MKRATPTHDSPRRTRARIAENSSAPKCTLVHTLTGHTEIITALTIMSPGLNKPKNMIVSGSRDNTARVWDAVNGTCLLTLVEHTQDVRFFAVLDNGTLATGSNDMTVRIWDVLQAQKQMLCIADALMDCTMLNQDVSNIIAEYARDFEGTSLFTLEGHTNYLSDLVAISPDKFASCSTDGAALI